MCEYISIFPLYLQSNKDIEVFYLSFPILIVEFRAFKLYLSNHNRGLPPL
jgi:hypothetical protein